MPAVEKKRLWNINDSLRFILEAWPTGKPRPWVQSTVPYGCNPHYEAPQKKSFGTHKKIFSRPARKVSIKLSDPLEP